ncbi:BatA domain-containing protein [Mangrovimonas cancribranchiae]|uniref:BatA domain-containing protein n=1 Tax=Mangrovimonas cancribranchiae TaxID=3080055 RepID=A0AAU6P164_9FLAO
MQFKHPEILYALFALIIPVIVHLFQLRKFKKQAFTNVAFLKKVKLQTRKSSQLKKWLILLSRLCLLTAIIIAFAQPYTSKSNALNKPLETVIYLDNSYSMQAKGKQGELFKRAVQDLISQSSNSNNVSVFTNNATFKNTTINGVKKELLQLDYTNNQLSYEAAYLKGEKLFNNSENSIKNFIFISDFQLKDDLFKPKPNDNIAFKAVQLIPESTNNLIIDSLYISKETPSLIELTALVNSNNSNADLIPVSLFNNNKLIAKTSVNLNEANTAVFSINKSNNLQGKISIDDTSLQFDNTLYFNINTSKKINVLAVAETDSNFLKRIFSKDEFNLTITNLERLNYSDIESQHLIILNEIESLPTPLINSINTFTQNGGHVILIPNKTGQLATYNSLLAPYGTKLTKLLSAEKRITTINYDHPTFLNVFNNKVDNFQYPKVNSFYNVTGNRFSSILKYEDDSPFLAQNGTLYLFTSPINLQNSTFQNSPLIVPTLYNIGTQSLKTPPLYNNLDVLTTFDVPISLNQDDVLTLELNDKKYIPQQQSYANKVTLTTNNYLTLAGVYNVVHNNKTIQQISYNSLREESQLTYQDLTVFEDLKTYNSVPKVLSDIKSETNINELWKWFVIFAMAFVLIEMLLLKYLK